MLEDPASPLTILVLALFVGFEVISKVPPLLHTPLMSGSNAISASPSSGAHPGRRREDGTARDVLGFIAIVFATINVVGGFLVTNRMLGCSRRSRKKVK